MKVVVADQGMVEEVMEFANRLVKFLEEEERNGKTKPWIRLAAIKYHAHCGERGMMENAPQFKPVVEYLLQGCIDLGEAAEEELERRGQIGPEAN